MGKKNKNDKKKKITSRLNLFRPKVETPKPAIEDAAANQEASPLDELRKERDTAESCLKSIAYLFWEKPEEIPPIGPELVQAIGDRLHEVTEALEDDDDSVVEAVEATLAAAFLAVLEDTVENGSIGPVPITEREEVVAAVARHRNLASRAAQHDLQQLQMAAGITNTASTLIHSAILQLVK